MKYLVVSCILFFCTLQTFSQQEYFIYLQTDNNQPFYVRINNNVYSSSAAGYLTLIKLADSTITITIGFPRNVFPEQQFNIPATHKDAGYIVKNLAGKGWELLNLQTQSGIMSNTAEEKKSPEISGIKRTDAFSSLLANAVNDTAVLYTVIKPPKPVPTPVLAAVEEKKKDTPQKDSAVFVKKPAEKRDSSLTVKNTSFHKKDTGSTAAHLPKMKEPAALLKNRKTVHDTAAGIKKDTGTIAAHLPKTKQPALAKNRKLNHDTVAVVKNSAPPPADLSRGNAAVKKDSILTVKNTPKQKKDTVITPGRSLLEQLGLAKTKKERKDTIILMNGKKPSNGNLTAKNTAITKEKVPLRGDTVQVIKKEILQAPEEKRNALLNNNDAVVIEKVPVKKDSLTNSSGLKKDTVQTLAKNETGKPSTNTDTVMNAPVKRLRPLVTKAAELLTDTSYIAVFVDESKDKFDTIRISIPFNETVTYAKQNKPVVKQAGTAVDKIIKDSTPAVISNPVPLPIKNNDTAAADRTVKNNTPVTIPQQTAAPALQPDSTAVDKKAKDSATAVSAAAVSPIVKKDTAAAGPAKESLPVTVNRETGFGTIKKDSVQGAAVPADSGKEKAPAPTLFLNSDCKEVAADGDIDKLRIKMLLVVTDEDRITLAKRLFKQKCVLVQQVKALSELFKNDEGKYKWFDAAYPFVSDTGNFSSLGDLIKDDYYLNRFKAMLRH